MTDQGYTGLYRMSYARMELYVFKTHWDHQEKGGGTGRQAGNRNQQQSS